MNGEIKEFNKNDTVETWNDILKQSVNSYEVKKLVNFSLYIDLISVFNDRSPIL